MHLALLLLPPSLSPVSLLRPCVPFSRARSFSPLVRQSPSHWRGDRSSILSLRECTTPFFGDVDAPRRFCEILPASHIIRARLSTKRLNRGKKDRERGRGRGGGRETIGDLSIFVFHPPRGCDVLLFISAPIGRRAASLDSISTHVHSPRTQQSVHASSHDPDDKFPVPALTRVIFLASTTLAERLRSLLAIPRPILSADFP